MFAVGRRNKELARHWNLIITPVTTASDSVAKPFVTSTFQVFAELKSPDRVLKRNIMYVPASQQEQEAVPSPKKVMVVPRR